MQRYIERERPALVVTSSLESYVEAGGAADDQSALIGGFAKSWRSIAKREVPLLVLADTPYMSAAVPDCLSQNSAAPERCRTSHDEAFALSGALQQAAAQSGARFLDLNDRICPGAACEPVIGDVLVYRDQQHLSATYARTLALVLAECAGELLSGAAPR